MTGVTLGCGCPIVCEVESDTGAVGCGRCADRAHRERHTARTVHTVLEALDELGARGTTERGLALRSGLSVATVHRVLRTLEQVDLVRAHPWHITFLGRSLCAAIRTNRRRRAA